MSTLKNFTTPICRLTLEVSEDMDNAYTFVKQGATNTDTCDLCDTAGELVLGVIDRNYDDGEFASIITDGFATVRAGAAVSAGALVATDSSGRAITATQSHNYVAGRAFTAASAAGDEIVVKLAPRAGWNVVDLGFGLKAYQASIAAASSGFAAETDLFTLPAACVVKDAFINVSTAEATGTTKTVDVGTSTVSNDPDGFLDGVSVSATGIKKATATFTTGSNEVYFASSTYGDLLAPTQVAGADAAGDVGTYYEEKNDVTSYGAVVSASPGSADFAELAATVTVVVLEL